MQVSTKIKSATIKVPTNKKVTVSVEDFRQREIDRRIEEKTKILDRCSSSEDIFDMLRDEINTLSQDEHSHDFTVGDEYNFGVDYDVDLLLELIRDLREFTRYNHYDDNKSIKQWNLDYLRNYF